MKVNLRSFKQKVRHNGKQLKSFLRKIENNTPKGLDQLTKKLSPSVWKEIDCLSCANCCKTTSPIFTDRDINRISAHFKVRPANFVEKYLHLDEDEDYVLNEAPCTFLGTDNYCSIYEVAPRACREYPHTNRKQIYKILNLTIKNMAICPAVFEIVQKLKEIKN